MSCILHHRTAVSGMGWLRLYRSVLHAQLCKHVQNCFYASSKTHWHWNASVRVVTATRFLICVTVLRCFQQLARSLGHRWIGTNCNSNSNERPQIRAHSDCQGCVQSIVTPHSAKVPIDLNTCKPQHIFSTTGLTCCCRFKLFPSHFKT